MDSLTSWQKKHEDSGYILQKNVTLTRATIVQLQMRRAHSTFCWVEGHNRHVGNEAANALAAVGADKEIEDQIEMDIPPAYSVMGAKLSAMTQKLAYRAIHQLKDAKMEVRLRTAHNMDMVISGAAAVFKVKLREEAVWKSL